MNINLKMALAATAMVAAMPASAATILLPNAPTVIFPGKFSASFGNSAETPGSFNDNFNFTTLTGGVSGGVISIGGAQDIVITSVKLDSTLFTQVLTGANEIWTLALTNIGAGPHTINVTGTWDGAAGSEGGSYGGQLSFKVAVGAAPEPATWGMMIAGFGIAGVALRRRRRENVRVTYA